jgi:ABC-type phosphate transport system substrate-binding protein
MNKRCLAILLFGVFLNGAVANAQDAVVVVNNGVKATAASSDDIRNVFTGEKSSLGDGSRVTPVTLKAGPTHEAFLKIFVGKGDNAYRTAWRNLVFTGQGSMPKMFDTEAALVDYVAATPGAIGYVGKGTEHEKVKTLAVK